MSTVSFQVYKRGEKNPFRIITANLSDLPKNLVEKIPLCLQYGWKLIQYHESLPNQLSLSPPDHYQCLNWASTFEYFKIEDTSIEVPGYFYASGTGIIKKGTW
jgi:hypothetical protein